MINILKKLWNFSKKRQKNIVKTLFFSFIEGFFILIKMLAIIYTIYALVGEQSIKNSIIGIIIIGIICIIGGVFTGYAVHIATIETGYGMVGDKRIAFGDLLKNVHLGFFSESSIGRISSVLTTTLSGIQQGSTVILIGVIGGGLGSITMLIGLLIYEWRIGIITGIGMVLYFSIVNWQIKVSKRDAPARQKAQSELAITSIAFLQGIKVTKAFSFKNGDTTFKRAIKGSCDENIRLSKRCIPLLIAGQLCIAIFEVLIIILTLLLYFNLEVLTIEKAIVLIIISFTVYGSVGQAGSMLSMIGIIGSALDESENLEQTEKLICMKPLQTMQSNEIIFENVSFAYGVNEVLSNISTTIKPHSFTAIIGPSGSGKSTFCQLIPRFWEVTSGTIRIGGADIRHIETSDLMEKISMVFQKVYLFEDTILNNIRFGNPTATLDEVRTSAKSARCDDFIMSLPNRYETLITEGGGSLSGGEKQRISIARAILKDAPIIILDEATSALDSENEHEILQAIDELTRNKTVIMIAHRMKSVQGADQIIVLDKGVIVGEGTHEQLVANSGLYTRFLNDRQQAQGWKVR